MILARGMVMAAAAAVSNIRVNQVWRPGAVETEFFRWTEWVRFKGCRKFKGLTGFVLASFWVRFLIQVIDSKQSSGFVCPFWPLFSAVTHLGRALCIPLDDGFVRVPLLARLGRPRGRTPLDPASRWQCNLQPPSAALFPRRRSFGFNNLTALILHFCLWHGHPWPWPDTDETPCHRRPC